MNRTPTILIVEDDEDTIHLIEFFVQKAGYQTLLATDGRAALEMVKAHRPDLLVLDLMLPEVHGIAVCETIKVHPATRHIKVLMISAKHFPADQRQAEEAGADLFMTKPLNGEKFLAAIKNLLASQ